jgi:hypothetical protein
MRIENKRKYLILYFAMMLVSVCVVGCGPGNKAIVRYQNIPIPAYERSDYEKLLTSEEHEVKYNAICNLIPYASKYASVLEKGFSEKSSGNNTEDNAIMYHNAQQVFEAIGTELQSNNESIKAASLMFITEFSLTYSDKKQLFVLVSQVNTKDVRTQYEQIQALLHLVDSDTEIDKTLYNGLEKEAHSDDLNALRNAVQQNNTAQEAWQEYTRERFKEKEQEKREEELRRAILPQYTEMLERFLEESKRLFANSGMNAEEIEDATEEMRELLQIFKEEQAEE